MTISDLEKIGCFIDALSIGVCAFLCWGLRARAKQVRSVVFVALFFLVVGILPATLTHKFTPSFGALLGIITTIPVGMLLVARVLAGDSRSARMPTSTPTTARILAHWLMPYKASEVLLGDLEERFPNEVAAKGLRIARLWYTLQVLFSIPTLLWAAIGAVWGLIWKIAK